MAEFQEQVAASGWVCDSNHREQAGEAEGVVGPGGGASSSACIPLTLGAAPQGSGGAVPGRAWQRVPVCETGGPRGAGGQRRRQEHGRVS